MTKRVVLVALGPCSGLILVSFFLGEPVGTVLFAMLAVAFPIGLIAVGAAKDGRLGPLAWPLGLLLLVLEAAMLGMIVLRGRLPELPWVGGLPLAAAIQLYGMWLLPLALVALAYALTFDRFTLTDEDLRHFREEVGLEEAGRPAAGREEAGREPDGKGQG
ncbi:MAG: hypothetical protein O7A04_01725 [Acidobacteria bacterium]|nr:hypothetical protein [Acidobacteriota bacterium]